MRTRELYATRRSEGGRGSQQEVPILRTLPAFGGCLAIVFVGVYVRCKMAFMTPCIHVCKGFVLSLSELVAVCKHACGGMFFEDERLYLLLLLHLLDWFCTRFLEIAL